MSICSSPAPVKGHDKQTATVTLQLCISANPPMYSTSKVAPASQTPDKTVRNRVTLDLPFSTKVSETKLSALALAQTGRAESHTPQQGGQDSPIKEKGQKTVASSHVELPASLKSFGKESPSVGSSTDGSSAPSTLHVRLIKVIRFSSSDRFHAFADATDVHEGLIHFG